MSFELKHFFRWKVSCFLDYLKKTKTKQEKDQGLIPFQLTLLLIVPGLVWDQISGSLPEKLLNLADHVVTTVVTSTILGPRLRPAGSGLYSNAVRVTMGWLSIHHAQGL